MFTKIFTVILVVFNPLAFLVADNIETIVENPIIWENFAASALLSTNPNFLPIRDWEIEEPEIEAKSAIVFNMEKNRVLYEKEVDRILPIASLTKLMTALIVLENIELDEITIISEEAVKAYGETGELVVKEKISIRNLLHALLMESSNDAAVALSEAVEQKTDRLFTSLMNEKVDQMKLTSTRFSDSSGFNSTNISTVREIIEIVKHSFNQEIIWQILKTTEIDLYSDDDKIKHHWVNTDELLNQLPNVIGGKTGYTTEAQGCLILVVEISSEKIISVILGAQERFLETEKLIKWAERAYQW